MGIGVLRRGVLMQRWAVVANAVWEFHALVGDLGVVLGRVEWCV